LEPAAVAAVSQVELLAGSFIKTEAVDSRHFREHFWNEVNKKLTRGFSNYDDVGHLLRITYPAPTPLRRFESV
jgi:ribulose bisphosphate carboxylase small subunit